MVDWMVRGIFIFSLTFLGTLSSPAQTKAADSLLAELATAPSDSHRLHLQLALLKERLFENPDSIIQSASTIRSKAATLKDTLALALSWKYEGWAHDRKGSHPQALQAYTNAQAFYRAIDDLKGELNSAVNIGNAHRQMGKPDLAMAVLERAWMRAAASGDQRSVALAENNIAILHAQEGEYEMAGQRFRQVLQRHVALGDSLEVANLCNNLGNIYLKLGDYSQSIAYYVRAARIDEELKNFRGLATDYGHIAIIYKELENWEQALEYAESSYRVFAEIGNGGGMVGMLNMKAVLFRAQRQFEAALQENQKALELCQEMGVDGTDLGEVYEGLGHGLLHLGQPRKAMQRFKAAESIYQEWGWDSNLPLLYASMGKAARQTGQLQEAASILSKGKAMAEDQGETRAHMMILREMSQLSEMVGDHAAAMAQYSTAEALEDSLYSLENNAQIADIQASYDIEKKRRELAEERHRAETLDYENALNRSRFQLTVALSAALMVVGLGFFAWLRYRVRQLRLLREKEQTIAEQKLREKQAESRRLQELSQTQARELGKRSRMLQELKTELEQVQNKPDSGPEDFIHLFKVVEHNIRSEEDWEQFKTNFEKIHPRFFPKLLEQFPRLTPAEIRLCVLLRLGMGQKDIANILNIAPDSVKRARNRLRSKLALETDQNLRAFLNGF